MVNPAAPRAPQTVPYVVDLGASDSVVESKASVTAGAVFELAKRGNETTPGKTSPLGEQPTKGVRLSQGPRRTYVNPLALFKVDETGHAELRRVGDVRTVGTDPQSYPALQSIFSGQPGADVGLKTLQPYYMTDKIDRGFTADDIIVIGENVAKEANTRLGFNSAGQSLPGFVKYNQGTMKQAIVGDELAHRFLFRMGEAVFTERTGINKPDRNETTYRAFSTELKKGNFFSDFDTGVPTSNIRSNGEAREAVSSAIAMGKDPRIVFHMLDAGGKADYRFLRENMRQRVTKMLIDKGKDAKEVAEFFEKLDRGEVSGPDLATQFDLGPADLTGVIRDYQAMAKRIVERYKVGLQEIPLPKGAVTR